MWIKLRIALLLGAVVTGGCGGTTPQATWVSAQGGVIQGTRHSRAEAALVRLGSPGGRAVHVNVLDSDAVGAFAWPSGTVFVTRGLIDLVDDRELAAAIAHEVGHLLDDGHLQTVVGLRGCRDNPDREARADAIGVRLLVARGIDPNAMISMLGKVRAATSVPPSCRPAISHRLELLRAAGQPSELRTAPAPPSP